MDGVGEKEDMCKTWIGKTNGKPPLEKISQYFPKFLFSLLSSKTTNRTPNKNQKKQV
jgi:hypothetical protein